MIDNLETETEKQQLEFVSPNPLDVDMSPLDVSPNPIDVDPMSLVPLDFKIELLKAKMRYNTPEIRAYRAKIAEAIRRYQEAGRQYLRGFR